MRGGRGGGVVVVLPHYSRSAGVPAAVAPLPTALASAKTEDREQTHLVHLSGCDGGQAGKTRRSHPVARSDRWSCRSAQPQSVSFGFHLGGKEE